MNILDQLPTFPPHPTKPSLTYLIASTPRSGSSKLMLGLWGTGALGAPFEHFNPRVGVIAPLSALKSKYTGPNGVFGVKSHWNDFESQGQPDFDKYIYIERQDINSQAVSYAIAAQTGKWDSHFHFSLVEPRYDLDLIRQCLKDILRQRQHWKWYFHALRIKPFRVIYEEQPRDIVQQIADYLEVPLDQSPISLPDIQIQRTPLNDEWVARFIHESC